MFVTCFLFAVIVLNFNNLYTFNLYPNILSIRICWYRILMWLKNKPIWIVKAASPLSFSVTFQIMKVSWQVSHILKCIGRHKVPNPLQI